MTATDLISEQTWWEVYLNHQVSRYHKLSWLREQKQISRSHHPYHALYQRLSEIRELVKAADQVAFHRDFAFMLLQLTRSLSEEDVVVLAEFYLPYLERISSAPHVRSYQEWVRCWPVDPEPPAGQTLYDWIVHLKLLSSEERGVLLESWGDHERANF